MLSLNTSGGHGSDALDTYAVTREAVLGPIEGPAPANPRQTRRARPEEDGGALRSPLARSRQRRDDEDHTMTSFCAPVIA